MGMYDSFYILGDDAERFRSPDGSVFHGRELQTKAFSCELEHYYVFNGRVFMATRGETSTRANVRIEDGQLCWSNETRIEAALITDRFHLYTNDDMCRPVLTLGPPGWSGDRFKEHQPWVEWVVVVTCGQLVSVEPAASMQSRDALKEKLLGEGANVVPDTDMLAKRHFELLERP